MNGGDDPMTRDEVRADMAALVPRLRRFAYAICGDREEGDDLVQAACLKALTRLDQFRPGTRLDSWMFRIVQTIHIDRRRSARRRGWPTAPEAVEQLSDNGRHASRAEDRMLLARVRREIGALPDDQRAAVALVAIEGYSYKEAAAILDVPIGTIMSRLHRARARLAPLVQDPTT